MKTEIKEKTEPIEEFGDSPNRSSNKDENIARITITKEADLELDKMVTEVNEGFTAGRVSKQDLVGWIVLKFKSMANEDYIEKVRADFFNEIARFKNLLKLAQQAGGLTPEIRLALKELTQEAPRPKRSKNTLKDDHIKDMVKSEGKL